MLLSPQFNHSTGPATNKFHSAWWGKSFVTELARISEQGERKTRRRESLIATAPVSNSDAINGWDPSDGFDGAPAAA